MIPSDLNNGCFANYVKGEFDVVTSGVGVDIDDDASDGITVINTYDTEKYKEMAEKAYDWNQKGYFMPDSTTNTTTRQDLFRANTAFSYYGSQHPGTATQETMNSGKEIVSIPIGRSTISTSAVNFCQWAIPAQCENPKKLLQSWICCTQTPTSRICSDMELKAKIMLYRMELHLIQME